MEIHRRVDRTARRQGPAGPEVRQGREVPQARPRAAPARPAASATRPTAQEFAATRPRLPGGRRPRRLRRGRAHPRHLRLSAPGTATGTTCCPPSTPSPTATSSPPRSSSATAASTGAPSTSTTRFGRDDPRRHRPRLPHPARRASCSCATNSPRYASGPGGPSGSAGRVTNPLGVHPAGRPARRPSWSSTPGGASAPARPSASRWPGCGTPGATVDWEGCGGPRRPCARWASSTPSGTSGCTSTWTGSAPPPGSPSAEPGLIAGAAAGPAPADPAGRRPLRARRVHAGDTWPSGWSPDRTGARRSITARSCRDGPAPLAKSGVRRRVPCARASPPATDQDPPVPRGVQPAPGPPALVVFESHLGTPVQRQPARPLRGDAPAGPGLRGGLVLRGPARGVPGRRHPRPPLVAALPAGAGAGRVLGRQPELPAQAHQAPRHHVPADLARLGPEAHGLRRAGAGSSGRGRRRTSSSAPWTASTAS